MKRKHHKGQATRWQIVVPQALAAQVSLELMDPVTGIPSYGARSNLITKLLRVWLQERRDITSITPATPSSPDKEQSE